ncbi:hypothetical protein Bpfe_004446 [Biomphalaria pfeifferi]|uniref:H15 domain-containing protein n=1 Tax=Biomphalaria pfeifferi TaxID=112525 RepID=A0AAD8C4V4_BIOPF|nr:hypothetical protein Bpfe_004446 [Biomphalaria pfeifferi]
MSDTEAESDYDPKDSNSRYTAADDYETDACDCAQCKSGADDRVRITVKDVLSAIRDLREPQGVTFSMVKNYLGADPMYEDMDAKVLEKEVKLAMQKAINDDQIVRAKQGLRFILPGEKRRNPEPKKRGRAAKQEGSRRSRQSNKGKEAKSRRKK